MDNTPVHVTDTQREKFIALVENDKTIGNVDALRKVGVKGSRGNINRWLDKDQDLLHQSRLARGWNLNRVEATAWEVATNPEHPAWDRANARVLKAYHPLFRDQQRLEVTGEDGGPVVLAHEQRLTLAHVAALAAQLDNGSSASTGGELPAARPLLAASDDS
jgi:hypothetical protein